MVSEPSKAGDPVDLNPGLLETKSEADSSDDLLQVNVADDGLRNGRTSDEQQHEQDLNQLKVSELRQMCKTHDLKVRGRKDQILARLNKVLEDADRTENGNPEADDNQQRLILLRCSCRCGPA